jgi:hypothetical protein
LTYVDHDSLLAKLVQRHGSVDSTPIELDGATNTVDTTTENEDAVVVEGDVVGGGVVGSLKVKVSRCERMPM